MVLTNIDRLVRYYNIWTQELPRVEIYYGVYAYRFDIYFFVALLPNFQPGWDIRIWFCVHFQYIWAPLCLLTGAFILSSKNEHLVIIRRYTQWFQRIWLSSLWQVDFSRQCRIGGCLSPDRLTGADPDGKHNLTRLYYPDFITKFDTKFDSNQTGCFEWRGRFWDHGQNSETPTEPQSPCRV